MNPSPAHDSQADETVDLTPQQRSSAASTDIALPSRVVLPPSDGAEELNATIQFTPSRHGSRGLHIRCPHCSNGVDLLADSSLEEILCQSCGSSFNLVDRQESTSAMAPLKQVGRFELLTRLGVGGFGTVWKARDTELGRTVAIKIPRKGNLSSHEQEQFYREARAVAQLRHPNIVAIHEVGRDDDAIFIVCDFVRGISLNNWLTGQKPTFRESVEMCREVALALDHAHEHGVIHRDLKPSNILIDLEGKTHLMDFGLAKRETGEVTMTIDGHILGTPAYMSPEQASGHAHWTDRRTDIYSLGVILFELLTGEQPFRGNAQMQVHQRLTEDPPDPRKLNRHIPRDLSTICLKCMERDPNKRYRNARGVADEFSRFLTGQPIEARPLSHLGRLWRWGKRNPGVATAALLTLVLAVFGPSAALVFNAQRSRLAAMLTERDALIKTYAAEKQQDSSKLTQLNQKLDAWEGRANPWELWPPVASRGPKLAVLQKAFAAHYPAAVKQLESDNLSAEDRALGQMALAIGSEKLNEHEQAVKHYSAAVGLLEQLSTSQPEEARYLETLAQAYDALARLNEPKKPKEAEQYLAKANAILAQLSNEDRATLRDQSNLLDSEVRLATQLGFAEGQKHLEQSQQLSEKIEENWPTDPRGLYELTAFLSDTTPLLLPRSAK